jgi:predicted DNA-binding transcriptional regulator AlpA
MERVVQSTRPNPLMHSIYFSSAISLTVVFISCTIVHDMSHYSTRQAAKKLGIAHTTLAHYIRVGKVPAPRTVSTGATATHSWSDQEIENLRKLLPKIANGRKTRHQRDKKEQTKTKNK